ncbi:zinc knuckle CX2CX4HX4C containing protein [Tanacetum coccineum]|uniref:Zinc knuckle CX2CX4HX4C containing protein n=1 Tax=Tanacetum coccineum TaxID=301880 RepID=A0ABQ5EFJ5_9ASTR
MQDLTAGILPKFLDVFDRSPFMCGIIGVLRSPRRELRNELKYVQSGVKMNEISCLKSVFCNGPWMICGIPILLNKWSPSMSLLKEELTHVPVLVKFHDVPLVAYTSDGLSLMATKIGTPMMLDSYTNSNDHLVMAVPNLEGNGYTKETIRIEYEWEPPRCSTCLIFGHSPIDCPIVTPKRVVNQKDKGKGQTSGADDESFIEVKKKKSVANLGNEDEVEPIDNEMEGFLASKPMGVGFGPKSLLKQWRESNDYDPYNDDMYKGQEISDNIQTICDNLDIKNTCNNDKNLSEIQLEHEKEDELVAVVTLGGSRGESFWEECDDFRVDVLLFHTCLTDILGFLEKFGWWFEQGIGGENEDDNDNKKLVMVNEGGMS